MTSVENLLLKRVATKEGYNLLNTINSKTFQINKIASLKKQAISEDVLDSIQYILNIATPLVSFSGDFELTALLSNLKIWLSKKKAELLQEQAQRDAVRGLSWEDLGSNNYGW